MGSISVSTDVSQDLTTFTVVGEISASDIVTVVTQAYSSDPTSLALWNFRKASTIDISSSQINAIVHAVGTVIKNRPNPRTALVFGNKYGFGMGRMYEMMAESEQIPVTIHTFYDLDEAREWLLSV